MTAAVTGLSIQINDDGKVFLSAPDWDAEGHLWAIESRPISIAQLRLVATALGADASQGVEARLQGCRKRLRNRVSVAEARLKEVEAAKSALATLDAVMEP